MAKGKETGIPKPVTQAESEMAQPPPLCCSLEGSSSLYLHNLPSWVLEDFCQKMDCLNEYDWMRFGEQTEWVGERGEDVALWVFSFGSYTEGR